MGLSAQLAARLQRSWWAPRPDGLARLLQPLAWLVQGLARLHRHSTQAREARAAILPVPVLVVGNLIVGGAGKTPTIIALVQALQAAGWRPGVISRGYGRATEGLVEVTPATPALACGDEPLLVHRRTGVPVLVARDRLEAARALLARHPRVNLLLADDGLQHWRLPRDLQVLVFDERGVGNGLPLPAGPLRQTLPRGLPPATLVLYNAPRPSTPLPGHLALRRLGGAVSLAEWWQGLPARADTLAALARQSRERPMLAAAGLGQPERFFSMLESAGLQLQRLPLPDHVALDPLPWPADTPDLLLTEKDAAKLPPGSAGTTRVWVVTLDFSLPPDFTRALLAALPPPAPTDT